MDVAAGASWPRAFARLALIAEAWRRRRRRRVRLAVAAIAAAALGAGLYLGAARNGAPGSTVGRPPTSAPRAGLGLAASPYVGVACPGAANVTTCGRIGIAVWLSRRGASEVDATLAGASVRLQPPPRHTSSPSWRGFVHLPPATLGLPSVWFGSPARTLALRLRVRYGAEWRRGRVVVQLSPGWG